MPSHKHLLSPSSRVTTTVLFLLSLVIFPSYGSSPRIDFTFMPETELIFAVDKIVREREQSAGIPQFLLWDVYKNMYEPWKEGGIVRLHDRMIQSGFRPSALLDILLNSGDGLHPAHTFKYVSNLQIAPSVRQQISDYLTQLNELRIESGFGDLWTAMEPVRERTAGYERAKIDEAALLDPLEDYFGFSFPTYTVVLVIPMTGEPETVITTEGPYIFTGTVSSRNGRPDFGDPFPLHENLRRQLTGAFVQAACSTSGAEIGMYSHLYSSNRPDIPGWEEELTATLTEAVFILMSPYDTQDREELLKDAIARTGLRYLELAYRILTESPANNGSGFPDYIHEIFLPELSGGDRD